MSARHFLIHGHVQGVGFRYAMLSQARRWKLRGWVRNRSDGRVEAVAAGTEDALDALERWAQRGPSGAHVEHVEVRPARSDEQADLEERFSQRPTV